MMTFYNHFIFQKFQKMKNNIFSTRRKVPYCQLLVVGLFFLMPFLSHAQIDPACYADIPLKVLDFSAGDCPDSYVYKGNGTGDLTIEGVKFGKANEPELNVTRENGGCCGSPFDNTNGNGNGNNNLKTTCQAFQIILPTTDLCVTFGIFGTGNPELRDLNCNVVASGNQFVFTDLATTTTMEYVMCSKNNLKTWLGVKIASCCSISSTPPDNLEKGCYDNAVNLTPPVFAGDATDHDVYEALTGTTLSLTSSKAAVTCDIDDLRIKVEDEDLFDECQIGAKVRRFIITGPCFEPDTAVQFLNTLPPDEIRYIRCDDGDPCTFNDQQQLGCDGEGCGPCMGVPQCRPFWCDDGDPCTFNDRVMLDCDNNVCEPCMGTMDMADKDGDGIMDCEDACPHDPEKGEPGACGCHQPDTDSDGDGTPDCADKCPDNPFTDETGSCGSCDAPGIVDIYLSRQSACNDNGSSSPEDDYITVDVTVVFNFPPKLGGVDLSGSVNHYYNFENGNTKNYIVIPNQIIPANGEEIMVNVAYNGNEECNGMASLGNAPLPCSITPCIHPNYSIAKENAEGCVYDITLSNISKCDDNNTGANKQDDFVWGNVTIHLNNAPKEGMLVVSGMSEAVINLEEVKGDSYTFYAKINFNHAHGWVVAEIMDHDAYEAHVNAPPRTTKESLKYYYFGPELGACGMYKPIFECDPCTISSRNKQFTEFNAFKAERHVTLEFATNISDQTENFTIEKSEDGENFRPLLNKNGTQARKVYAKSQDEQPALGENYYRLKQVMKDGSVVYSPVKVVNFGIDLDAVNFFPNPAHNELFLDLDNYAGQKAEVVISNKYGQVMRNLSYKSLPEELITVDVTNFLDGLYLVKVKIGDTKTIVRKIFVSKVH